MIKFNKISKFSYHIVNNLCHRQESIIQKSTLLKLNDMKYTDKILQSSQFIYSELPVRFSRRIKELEELPLELDNHHEIFQIRDWYLKSLDDIVSVKFPDNLDKCHDIKVKIDNIYKRHGNTLTTMSEGINRLKENNQINDNVDFFLTNFYYNRTKTRFLIRNYLEYFNQNNNIIGCLHKNCNINNIVEDAIYDVRTLAEFHRYEIPEFKIRIDSNSKDFLYAKEYLNYCIVEVLKNSLVATQKIKNPNIEINSFQDKNMILLKISDNGFGISEQNLEKIWQFSFTTSKIDFHNLKEKNLQYPLCGFGYGLPITKILLNTFDGDIKLFSKKNIGTDIYIIIDLNSNWKF